MISDVTSKILQIDCISEMDWVAPPPNIPNRKYPPVPKKQNPIDFYGERNRHSIGQNNHTDTFF